MSLGFSVVFIFICVCRYVKRNKRENSPLIRDSTFNENETQDSSLSSNNPAVYVLPSLNQNNSIGANQTLNVDSNVYPNFSRIASRIRSDEVVRDEEKKSTQDTLPSYKEVIEKGFLNRKF